MEQNTVQVFTDLAYKACFKVINEKNKSFVLHDEQRLSNCLTRFVEAYNITSEQFFLKKNEANQSQQKQ